jgi:hypothetical protein
MREGSYPRLFGFIATLILPTVALWALFGEPVMRRAGPFLVAMPFIALVVMGVQTGSIWWADRGGYGAYKVSREEEPFWFWVNAVMLAGCAVASLYQLYR